jgi:hypothetical protein
MPLASLEPPLLYLCARKALFLKDARILATYEVLNTRAVGAEVLEIGRVPSCFRKRRCRRGRHQCRQDRRHREQQDRAAQCAASVSFRRRLRLSPFFALRSVYLFSLSCRCLVLPVRLALSSPFVRCTSLSLTPPYRARVNTPFAKRPLGIHRLRIRLCILVLIRKKASRGGACGVAPRGMEPLASGAALAPRPRRRFGGENAG